MLHKAHGDTELLDGQRNNLADHPLEKRHHITMEIYEGLHCNHERPRLLRMRNEGDEGDGW